MFKEEYEFIDKQRAKADAPHAPVPPKGTLKAYGPLRRDKNGNYFYQPPWGDLIPLSGNTGETRQREVDGLIKWYERFPTMESYNQYCHGESVGPLSTAKTSVKGVTFGTGAKRDARALRYDLIPPIALKRLAKIYTEGAEHYGVGNWQKGMDWSDTINHAIAHLLNYLNGDYNEDHLAKVAWAMFALMYFEDADVGNNDLYRWHWEKR